MIGGSPDEGGGGGEGWDLGEDLRLCSDLGKGLGLGMRGGVEETWEEAESESEFIEEEDEDDDDDGFQNL